MTLENRTETTASGALLITQFTRDYDADNRLIGMTTPDGSRLNWIRDTGGRITAITRTAGGVTTSLVRDRRYRADGLLLAQTLGNGQTETRTYNTRGELTSQQIGTDYDRTYVYDENGNLKERHLDTALASYPDLDAVMTYDPLDRLTNERHTYPGYPNYVEWGYGYDGNGNRTTLST